MNFFNFSVSQCNLSLLRFWRLKLDELIIFLHYKTNASKICTLSIFLVCNFQTCYFVEINEYQLDLPKKIYYELGNNYFLSARILTISFKLFTDRWHC